MKYDVKDIKLADKGSFLIEWLNQHAGVEHHQEALAKEKPLKRPNCRVPPCYGDGSLMQTLKAVARTVPFVCRVALPPGRCGGSRWAKV